MFVPTSTNVQKRSTSATSDVTNVRHSSSDELMFDLEEISKFSDPKTSEVQELALDVVSKMVESWLDSSNIVPDQPCSCAEDVFEHFGKFSGDRNNLGNTTGPKLDDHTINTATYQQKLPSEKRSNGIHDIGRTICDPTTENSNEKRPRCNTGDKTASRSLNDQREDVVCNSQNAGRKISTGSRKPPNEQRDVVRNSENFNREVPSEYFDLVALHLPIILRLCFACPFGKVREKCRGILEGVKEKGLPVPCPLVFGPSGFIPSSEASASALV